MAIPSVCLSVTCWYCIETNAHIVKFFPQSDRGMNLVFWSLPPLQNSKRNCVSGGVKYTGVGTFAIFDWNRCISQKRYEIGPQLLWNTNRKSEAADRSVSIPMTLRDLERRDAMGQFFSGGSLYYVYIVWPRMTEIGIVTPKHFSIGWATPPIARRRAGRHCLQNVWDLLRVRTHKWETTTK